VDHKERRLRALSLRREGKTLQQIGDELGRSKDFARQMILKAEREERAEKNLGKAIEMGATGVIDTTFLSVRISNCLKNARISTWEELEKKSRKELMNIQNFGKRGVEELEAILLASGKCRFRP